MWFKFEKHVSPEQNRTGGQACAERNIKRAEGGILTTIDGEEDQQKRRGRMHEERTRKKSIFQS